MKHEKGWSFEQLMKIPHASWGAPKDIRVGVRDLSITDSDDKENIRFRKSKDGLSIRVYKRDYLVKKEGHETCDLGHRHPVAVEQTFHWFEMTLTPQMVAQFQEWLTDGHHKWRLQ
jgi:hypothetical protein